MNVSLKNIDAVNGVVKVEIVKADYTANVEKGLRNFRQKATVPGFRKGMVPMGLVKKMYGKSVLLEEINKMVSESLFGYIRENELNILGEPLPSLTEQQELDFDTQEDFEFCFDVALAPEVKIELSKADTLPYYEIVIDDEAVSKQIESYKANYGSYNQVDCADQEKDMLKGTLAELENGLPKEGGIVVEGAVLMPTYIKNEAEKAKFAAVNKNAVVVFNPFVAFDGAEAELASLLKIEKDQVATTTGDFSFEVTEITRHQEAELGAELYERVFGKDAVSTEEEFIAKVKESLVAQVQPESTFKFVDDARVALLAKAANLEFPDAFLKRWMLTSGENKTAESVEEEYPRVIEDLKYHLIKESLVKANDIKVEETDVIAFAKRVAQAQFAQYGMMTVPEEVLENYAKDMLKNKDTMRNIVDRAIEEKLAACIKELVTLDVKEVSTEEFGKLFA